MLPRRRPRAAPLRPSTPKIVPESGARVNPALDSQSKTACRPRPPWAVAGRAPRARDGDPARSHSHETRNPQTKPPPRPGAPGRSRFPQTKPTAPRDPDFRKRSQPRRATPISANEANRAARPRFPQTNPAAPRDPDFHKRTQARRVTPFHKRSQDPRRARFPRTKPGAPHDPNFRKRSQPHQALPSFTNEAMTRGATFTRTKPNPRRGRSPGRASRARPGPAATRGGVRKQGGANAQARTSGMTSPSGTSARGRPRRSVRVVAGSMPSRW